MCAKLCFWAGCRAQIFITKINVLNMVFSLSLPLYVTALAHASLQLQLRLQHRSTAQPPAPTTQTMPRSAASNRQARFALSSRNQAPPGARIGLPGPACGPLPRPQGRPGQSGDNWWKSVLDCHSWRPPRARAGRVWRGMAQHRSVIRLSSGAPRPGLG